MAIKSYELKFGTFSKAADDEPLFVLRAQDKFAPVIIALWAAVAEECGVSAEKVLDAKLCARSMREWQGDKKTPD